MPSGQFSHAGGRRHRTPKTKSNECDSRSVDRCALRARMRWPYTWPRELNTGASETGQSRHKSNYHSATLNYIFSHLFAGFVLDLISTLCIRFFFKHTCLQCWPPGGVSHPEVAGYDAVLRDKLILCSSVLSSPSLQYSTLTLLPLSTALKVPVTAAAVKQLNAGSVDHFASCCMDLKIPQ